MGKEKLCDLLSDIKDDIEEVFYDHGLSYDIAKDIIAKIKSRLDTDDVRKQEELRDIFLGE